jgi:predicted membrane-bound mannosyltransferase
MAGKKIVSTPKPAQKVVSRTINNQPGFVEKNALKIAIAMAVVGLILRLYRIGFLSLWVDEYMHALAAIHGHFKHNENNGILLTWFNTTFAFFLGNTEFAMRLPVAILGACLIPTVYVLGKNVVNYRVGLMAAILTTFSLYLVFWSRVDRPYGMVATFYIPLLVCFWLMLEKKTANATDALSKFGVNKKYLILLPFALILCRFLRHFHGY